MPPREVLELESGRRTLRKKSIQLRDRHSRLSPLNHCGETFSLKSGTGALADVHCKHLAQAGRKKPCSDGKEAKTTGTRWY